jgi:hypothetical protein
MSGTLLSPVFSIGPRVVGQVLGLPFQQYRPLTATAPLGNLLTSSLLVWVTADSALKGEQPFKREKPDERYAGLDPSLTAVGDYLVGATTTGDITRTFFIAAQNVPAPIRLVECNRTLSVYQPVQAANYLGDVGGLGTVVLTGWPASVIQGTKGEAGAAKLPGDVRSPWFNALLPALSGVTIKVFDVAVDDEGQRYIISSVEQTPFGFRLTLSYAGT